MKLRGVGEKVFGGWGRALALRGKLLWVGVPGVEKLSNQEKAKRKRSFGRRLFSTLILWGLVVGVFVSGNAYAVGAAIGLLGMMGLWEWKKLWEREADKWCLWCMLAVGFAYLAVSVHGLGGEGVLPQDAEWVAILMVAMGSFVVRFRRGIDGREAIVSVSVAVLGLIYLGLMFGGGLIRIVSKGGNIWEGLWLLMVVLVGTKFTDMGAYLVGSLIGRHKMIPHISPAKTWEGFVGALLVCQLGVWGIKWIPVAQLDWVPGGWMYALLGVIIALGAVAGDLAESVLKRSLAAKDSGDALPGIGGILDLIDSICFTGPLVWMFMKLTT